MKKTRFLSILLCLCLFVSIFAGFTSDANAEDVITHTVANGEYLFKICKNYGLDFYQCKNAIMLLNGFTSETQLNRLSVGQKIKLPANNAVAATAKSNTTTTTTVSTTLGSTITTTTTTSSAAGKGAAYGVAFYLTPHVIAGGETLNSICNALGTNYNNYSAMILAMNNIKNAGNIWAGKTVYIPTSTAPASGGYAVIAHTVAPGETMTSICSQYGINYAGSATLINGLNAGKNMNSLYAGQIVYVPTANTSISSSTSSTAIGTTPAGTAPSVISSGYSIKFEATDYGSPYATVNGSKVTASPEGNKILIVSNADSGFNIKSIEVIRLDTNANVVVSENSFVMPASNVSVKVTYSNAMRITKIASEKGKFRVLVNGSEEAFAHYGNVITVVPAPSDGYAVTKVTYQNSEFTTSPVVTVNADSSGDYKFNMPNYPINVTVVFEKAIYYKLPEATKTGTGSGTVKYTTVDNDSPITKAAANAKVFINITPSNGSVVRFAAVNGKGIEVSDNYGLTRISDNLYSFRMPLADVSSIRVEFYKVVTYAVTEKSTRGGSLKFNVVDGVTGKITYNTGRAKAGDTVVVTPFPDSECVFYRPGTTVRYANGAVSVTLSDYNSTYCGYMFTMPAADVTVTPFWEKNSVPRFKIFKASTTNGSYYTSVDDGKGNIVAGDTSQQGKQVTITVTPAVGYVVAKDKNGNDMVYFSYGGVDYLTTKVDDTHYTFWMPGCDVTIKVTFERSKEFTTVNYPTSFTSGAGTMHVSVNGTNIPSGSKVRVGETLKITVTASAGYSIGVVTANGSTVTAASAGVYNYKISTADMPTLTLDATFPAIDYTIQYSITDTSVIMGLYEIYVDGAGPYLADVPNAHAGQLITLEITPASGCELEELAVDNVNVTANVDWNGGVGTYSYRMPAAKSITRASFKKEVAVPTEYTITVLTSGYTVAPSPAKAGETVTITPAGSDFILRDTTSESNDITSTYKLTADTFKMPAGNVTLEVIP